MKRYKNSNGNITREERQKMRIETMISNGEECYMCCRPLSGEISKYDGKMFCCDECLGKYLTWKHEDEIEYFNMMSADEFAENEKLCAADIEY